MLPDSGRGQFFDIARVVAVFSALVLLACIGFVALKSCDESQCESESKGNPARGLDIVSYDPPVWGKERISDCWEVEDRLNNRKYWLIKIDGQWIPLDIGEVENLG